MNLSLLISAGGVRNNVVASSKKAALEHLAEILSSEVTSLTTQDVLNCLINREKLGSTGLGHGVAIPHGRIGVIDQPAAAFLKLQEAVDFDAVDNQPVDLVFGLLVPEDSTEEHLQILSSIAEKFSQPGFADSLRKSASTDQLLQLLTE